MPTDRARAGRATSALLLACALVLASCGSEAESPGAESAGAESAGAGPSASTGTAAGRGSSPSAADPSPGLSTGSSTDAPGSDAPGSDPSGDASGGASSARSVASELEASATQSPDGTGLPGLGRTPTGPLVSRPLPRAASASGRLVTGFPARVVVPVPGSDIDTSAVTSEGPRLQATLTATTSRSVDRVLLHFRMRLARLGFVEDIAPLGATEIRFTRGPSTATVTAAPTPARTSYAVIATLLAS